MAYEHVITNAATGETTVVPFTPEEIAAAEEAAANAPGPVLRPEVYAVANLGINAGEISGIETAAKFSAAMYLDVGYYLLFFTETQPDTSYLAKAYDDATRVRVTEKGTDYIAVTVTDNADNPVDPAEISVEIIRVI